MRISYKYASSLANISVVVLFLGALLLMPDINFPQWAVIVVLLCEIRELAEKLALKKELEEKEKHLQIERIHSEQLECINRRNAGELHDVKYILQTAESLVGEGECEQARTVLSNTREKIIKINSQRYCRCSVVNVILNRKREEAERRGIAYHAEVDEMVGLGKLEAEKIIIVLGNMLDNAIEAAGKLTAGAYVRVQIKMCNHGAFLSISVENNCEEEPVKRGGVFVSGKRDGGRHGLGLQSVSGVVRECNGVEQISCEDRVFRHRVVLGIR